MPGAVVIGLFCTYFTPIQAVTAGGVAGPIGWKAKALGWNQELWREKATGV
jgi:hypothetical protein